MYKISEKRNELTPEEESILKEILLERLYNLFNKRVDQLTLREGMLRIAMNNFCDRFKYTYPEKILEAYDDVKKTGAKHVIYYEPHFFLVSIMSEVQEEGFPFPKEGLSFDSKAYFYQDYHDIRNILENWHYNYGMKKALVIEESHMFDVEKLPDFINGEPCSPLEAAVYMASGFSSMGLEPFVTKLFPGAILTIEDKLKFNKRLGGVH